MKVLIIEDEYLAAERMVELLFQYDKSIEVADTLDSIKDVVVWLKSNAQPDLIFMDIQLADGLCFDIFAKVSVESPVIFTTAYEEYAIRAFKVNSVDYLLKPIDSLELKAALEKFRKQFSIQKEVPVLSDNLIQSIKKMLAKPIKNRFIIKVGDHLKSVLTDEILYFFSLEKTTNFYTIDSRTYIIDYSLDHLMEIIDNEKFFRVSRKNIISREAIADIVVYSKSQLKIKLKNPANEALIVSREKVNAFKKWLDE
jgi:two-component system, LytTR family, response regulator